MPQSAQIPKVKLAEIMVQLQRDNFNTDQASALLRSSLEVEPTVLIDFTSAVEIELAIVHAALLKAEKKQDFVRAIELLCQSVHSLKGNAVLLNLPFIAEMVGEFEEKLLRVSEQKDLSWQSFLPIAFELAGMQNINEKIKTLVGKLLASSVQWQAGRSALEALPGDIERFVQKTASDLGKQIRLVATDINFAGVSNKFAYFFRDILIQLVRNAAAHSIELPEKRRENGKNDYGNIQVSLKPVGESFNICFRDDGNSFDVPAIRARAIELGKAEKSEIDQWPETEVINLIYERHFSTVSEPTLHCGRGLGMDIIRQRIHTIGGLLKLNYVIGKFTEFEFTIPMRVLQ